MEYTTVEWKLVSHRDLFQGLGVLEDEGMCSPSKMIHENDLSPSSEKLLWVDRNARQQNMHVHHWFDKRAIPHSQNDWVALRRS